MTVILHSAARRAAIAVLLVLGPSGLGAQGTSGSGASPAASPTGVPARAVAGTAACSGPRERKIRPKVVNGWPAAIENWPGMVALRIRNAEHRQSLYLCGGTLVSPKWVMTAAHCFDLFDAPQPPGQRVAASGVELERFQDSVDNKFSGVARLEAVHDTDDLKAVTAPKVADVEEIIVHPGYKRESAQSNGNDIALVRLASPLPGPFGRLSLTGTADPATPPGTRAMSGGMGLLDQDQAMKLGTSADGESFLAGSAKMQEADLPTVAEATCRAAYPGSAIGDGQICAGYPDGTRDTCQGDSGGPLVAFDRIGCPYQVGIVSWGGKNDPDKGKLWCAKSDIYGVYSRVSYFVPWIRGIVDEPLQGVQADDAGIDTDPQALKELTRSALDEIDRLLASSASPVTVKLIRSVDEREVADRRLRVNVAFKIELVSPIPGRAILLDVDAGGDIIQIFPNGYAPETEAGRITAGQPLTLPGKGWKLRSFTAGLPAGESRLVAIVVPDGFPLAKLVTAPARAAKGVGMGTEPAPLFYVASLMDQIARSTQSPQTTADRWGYAVVKYLIVKE